MSHTGRFFPKIKSGWFRGTAPLASQGKGGDKQRAPERKELVTFSANNLICIFHRCNCLCNLPYCTMRRSKPLHPDPIQGSFKVHDRAHTPGHNRPPPAAWTTESRAPSKGQGSRAGSRDPAGWGSPGQRGCCQEGGRVLALVWSLSLGSL